jgi:hypothetical protein
MFQYALGRALSIKFDKILKFDLSFYNNNILDLQITKRNFDLEHFCIDVNLASVNDLKFKKRNSIINFLSFKKTKIYNDLNFDNTLDNNYPIYYFDGFWQSELFFKEIRGELLKEFTPKIELDLVNMNWLNSITNSNSVAVHIRRGDYITNLNANAFHGICTVEYYKNAIQYIKNNTSDPSFYFFSDDMPWVKNHFHSDEGNYNFIENNISDKSYLDITLMASCKHNIIANSTFSWWGAWLNNNSNKTVIAPTLWFSDLNENRKAEKLIPTSWIRI